MSRRPDAPLEESSNSAATAWLLPFAALLLLVFALFVILYAGSQRDSVKTQQLVDSLRAAFGTQVAALSELPFRGEGAESGATSPSSPSVLSEALQKAIQAIPGAKLQAEPGGAWRLRIPSEWLFPVANSAADEGSARVSAIVPESVWPLLDRLGEALKGAHTGKVRIEGHVRETEFGETPATSLGEERRRLWTLGFERAYALSAYWGRRLDWPEASWEVVSFGATQAVLENAALSSRIELVWVKAQ